MWLSLLIATQKKMNINLYNNEKIEVHHKGYREHKDYRCFKRENENPFHVFFLCVLCQVRKEEPTVSG